MSLARACTDKYARRVALPLARLAFDDDVRHMAIAALQPWVDYGGIAAEAAEVCSAAVQRRLPSLL